MNSLVHVAYTSKSCTKNMQWRWFTIQQTFYNRVALEQNLLVVDLERYVIKIIFQSFGGLRIMYNYKPVAPVVQLVSQ